MPFNINTENLRLKQAVDRLPIYAYCPESETILEICKEMVSILDGNTLHARLHLESCICKILSILLRQEYAIADYSDANVRKHHVILLAADRYLHEHLQEPVNLVQLSKGSGLHPTYFHKLFTAAFKRTPSEQLMWYRINSAMHMLYSDDRPISEIAEQCGFSSQNYFSYKFKEQPGESPSKYRRERRKKNPIRGAYCLLFTVILYVKIMLLGCPEIHIIYDAETKDGFIGDSTIPLLPASVDIRSSAT